MKHILSWSASLAKQNQFRCTEYYNFELVGRQGNNQIYCFRKKKLDL